MEHKDILTGSGKNGRKWRSGHWRAVAGVMAMVAALAVVWAMLASLTLWQRDRDLAKATHDLNDLREDIQRLQRVAPSPAAEEYPVPDWESEEDDRDLIELLEAELGIITSEE